MFLLLYDLRLDLFARLCAGNENNTSVAKAPESVAAIDILRYVNR